MAGEIKLRGAIFSLEALLTLLVVAALVSLFRTPIQEDFSYARVYQLQLTQDFLETITKNQAANELFIQFLNENQQAKAQLQSTFNSLLEQTSAVCFVLEAENKRLETSHCTNTGNYVSAQAIAFNNEKNEFIKLKGTSYFR